MTTGEIYHLHCPLCGEEIEFQMGQHGQNVLLDYQTCDCGQMIGVKDTRAMNKTIGETGLRQNLMITLDDVPDAGVGE